MAGFTSPSILFISTWDAPERAYLGELLPKLKAAGYTDYHEPSVGGFAMPLVAADAGYSPAQMTTSDVHLFTSILGELAAGNDMASLGVQIDGEPVDYLSTKPLEQAAQLIWLQMRMRIEAKPDTHYWITMLEDLWNNREAHLDEFRAQLERLSARLPGINYSRESVWEHLDRVADNPNAVIVSNPPTYTGAYEKFFDTKDRLTWDAPEYEIFHAPTDIPRMVEEMEGRAALLVVQQQQEPRSAANPRPPYARQLSAGQLVYVNSNRPDEVEKIMGGMRVVRRKLPPLTERPFPILPPDYEVSESTKVELIEVEGKVADAYRHEWMHRLNPVPGPGNVLMLMDGYAAGVIGYSMQAMTRSFSMKWADKAILRFAFGAKHETLRLTRLATMLALQHDTLELTTGATEAFHVAACAGLVTVEMTRHPEAKGLRGLMKLDSRDKHQDGFKLVYASEWRPAASPSEVLVEFLSKEQAWLKSRK